MVKAISIAGCGPGSPDFIPAATHNAVAQAAFVVGAQRLLDLFPQIAVPTLRVTARIDEVLDELEMRREEKITVLVSGCPGVRSLATRVVERFGLDVCTIIPAVSSVQVAFARLGQEWFDAELISAHHAVPESPPESLARFDKIAVLAGNRGSADWLTSFVHELQKTHSIWLCENLTLPDERVRIVDTKLDTMLVGLGIVIAIRRNA